MGNHNCPSQVFLRVFYNNISITTVLQWNGYILGLWLFCSQPGCIVAHLHSLSISHSLLLSLSFKLKSPATSVIGPNVHWLCTSQYPNSVSWSESTTLPNFLSAVCFISLSSSITPFQFCISSSHVTFHPCPLDHSLPYDRTLILILTFSITITNSRYSTIYSILQRNPARLGH